MVTLTQRQQKLIDQCSIWVATDLLAKNWGDSNADSHKSINRHKEIPPLPAFDTLPIFRFLEVCSQTKNSSFDVARGNEDNLDSIASELTEGNKLMTHLGPVS